jgi:glycine betaine/proline transport system ATP-binding protein
MQTKIKIELKSLYKIFGAKPDEMISRVKLGASKAQLLENYGHVLALNNINLSIYSQKIHVVMGLSGSGKSTLIRHINRLIEPTSGSILFDDNDILEMNSIELRKFRRFKASMVFQNFSLLPHRTVEQNISYGMLIQGLESDKLNRDTAKWVKRVDLTGFEKYYPVQLSGGMQQRVGIARALATDSQVLLMDEPFSALDPLIRKDMQDVLLGLQRELSKTIVFITHDLDEALRLGDAITILKDGRIVQTGSSQDIILQPADRYVAEFTKDINRGRMIKIGSIMDKKRDAAGPELDKNLSIDQALQIIDREGVSEASVSSKNNIIGTVTLSSMIRALGKPSENNPLDPSGANFVGYDKEP